MKKWTKGWTKGRAVLFTVGVAAVLATACGDDGGEAASGTGPETPTSAEVEIVLDESFCAAFGDPGWVEFATTDQRTEEQAARVAELARELETTAPEALAEEVAAMSAGTDELVETWRAADFDAAEVDTGALTDLSTEAADSVHRIEGLAEESCGIPRGRGGLFATG